ncbi:MAG: hypothetical protein WDA00_01340 [Eubacteriales bacterium]
MLKRSILLLICLSLLGLMLVGCTEDEIEQAKDHLQNNRPTTERNKVTLNFYIMSASEISETAVRAMEERFNIYTEAKYRTRVKFFIYSPEAYAAALQSKFTAVEDAGMPDTLPAATDAYPELLDGQLDIFLNISDEMLRDNVLKGRLTDLTAYMTGTYHNLSRDKTPTSIAPVLYNNSYTKIATYISAEDANPTIVQQHYGVPNNTIIGEYTYLVVDKAQADLCYLENSFPLDGTANLTAVTAARTQLTTFLTNQKLTVADYIQEVTGDYGTRHQYDSSEYYVTIIKKPELTYKEIVSSMFCISAYTANADRAMEIIYELNTSAELHTILQYGVRDVTYTVDVENQTITKIADAPYTYDMNIRHTGNLFCIYPAASDGYTHIRFEEGYLQNKDVTAPTVPQINIYPPAGD